MSITFNKYKVLMTTAGFALASHSVFANSQDQQIEKSIENSYNFKTFLKDQNVKVDSNNKVVTLTGKTETDSQKSLAEETAKNVSNVRGVNNNIEVETKHEISSDPWILAKVKTSLMFHSHVSGLGTNVEVKDGVVVLNGEAESEAEKQLATEYARDIEGVKEVRNEMVVKSNPKAKSNSLEKKTDQAKEKARHLADKAETKVDDASITGQIKLALLTHKSTSALNTEVSTKNGVVTLKGTASSANEKQLATKLSKEIYGVREVNNMMTIKK